MLKYCQNIAGSSKGRTGDFESPNLGSSPSPAEKNIMDIKQAKNIISKYGKVVENIGIEKYPAAVFPLSLLPYPKETIKTALELFLLYSENENQKETIKAGLDWLDGFIDDTEANKRNDKIFKNTDFIKALRKTS